MHLKRKLAHFLRSTFLDDVMSQSELTTVLTTIMFFIGPPFHQRSVSLHRHVISNQLSPFATLHSQRQQQQQYYSPYYTVSYQRIE